MNLTIVVQAALTLIGGVIGASLTYKGTQSNNRTKNEGVYAHSMPELIDRVQDLLEQLESKNGKIAELTSQVESQSQTIDALTKQVGEMQRQITRLTKGQVN